MKTNYISGETETAAGNIPLVSTKLSRRDHFGAIKVRWLIGRNNYRVKPGLYGTGNPTDSSDVFVTANYKLSFDYLRKNLDGLDAWILVLDTRGVNVWCAAGKGTFGTEELVNKIRNTQLDKIISHRRLIVPQLGATGVSAYKVKELTTEDFKEENLAEKSLQYHFKDIDKVFKVNRGYQVIFGPVRAADIKLFLQNNYKTTEEMRQVAFSFNDRLKLIPVDLVYARYRLLAAFAVILLISGLSSEGILFKQMMEKGIPAISKITMAYATGIVITPLFLPYIPVRMFAFKGLISGIILGLFLFGFSMMGNTILEIFSWFLLLSGISSFMAMNFTGASTFTSLSGVKKEMRTFVPIQISFAGFGLIMLTINNLLF